METLQVDMLAEARNAQWSADTFLGPGAQKLVAPAKVNLFLGVNDTRDDGLHEVVTVMHALALHDVLHVQRTLGRESEVDGQALPSHMAFAGPEDNILVKVTSADKTASTIAALDVPAADNLVVRALHELAVALDHRTPECIGIHLEKNIPSEAGLGGGSSDAAAMLKAAASWWEAPCDGPTLHEVAARLGADVAFFLQGGCALFEGAGERLRTHLEPAKTPVVLVKPATGVPTAEAYARFDEMDTPVPANLLAQAEDAKRACEVPLYNSLEPAACIIVPELVDIREWLEQRVCDNPADNARRVLMTGSGSCMFALTDSFSDASRIAAQARAQGWWSRATSLSRLSASVV